MDEMTSSSEKSSGNRYASFPNMRDNHILFQSCKKRKPFAAHKADESLRSNGDNAILGGNLTPIATTRTKIKLFKMRPAESLQPNSEVGISNRDTWISGTRDRIHELKRSNGEKYARKEKFHVGGSLNMLVDAIQLVEDLKPQNVIDLKAQKKDLVCLVPENIRQINNFVGKPIMQRNQYWTNGGVDSECSPNEVDLDVGETMPLTRSRRGWLPTLPSKYSDSVLQPWKKITRKVPKF